ncbi:MAG TPA: zinc-binding alcohol dehydrogenase family protein [Bacteroidaceae bacterium]|nr:zinc-binding alcohol dehydrogenase family protein [Bacteroidaceae bacterium]
MKAIGYQRCLPVEDIHALQDIDLEAPHASGHDILVEIQAISVNPVDYKVRLNIPPDEGQWKVIGWDAVGIVKDVGDKVTLFEKGNKVWYAGDLNRPGSYAQYQLVDERLVGCMPQSLSYSEAAALPLTTITAWEMLFNRLQIPTEETEIPKTVLVIGAAGGVGSIMVQLLRKLTHTTVVATASREESVQWLKDLGVHYIINHNKVLSEELQAIGIPQVDYVISLNNTEEHYKEIVRSIAPQGHFGLIDDPSHLDVMQLKSKSVTIHWEFMFTRSMFHTPDMVEQHRLLNAVSRMIDNGEIKTTLTHHLGQINAENLRKAHAMLESKEAYGKIVLEGF